MFNGGRCSEQENPSQWNADWHRCEQKEHSFQINRHIFTASRWTNANRGVIFSNSLTQFHRTLLSNMKSGNELTRCEVFTNVNDATKFEYQNFSNKFQIFSVCLKFDNKNNSLRQTLNRHPFKDVSFEIVVLRFNRHLSTLKIKLFTLSKQKKWKWKKTLFLL